MRSIFGECSGNVRSTPTPNDCFRTVKVSRAPRPWRRMTMPSNTWVRRRLPSTTWKWTRTRSPARKDGTRRSCARSMLSMTPVMGRERPSRHKRGARPAGLARVANGSEGPPTPRAVRGRRAPPGARRAARGLAAAGLRASSAAVRPLSAALGPPGADAGVVPGEQDPGHRVAAPLRRPGVLRVLGRPAEGGAEGLLDRALGVTKHPRELPHDRIADDHRRELSAGEDVWADRDHVGREVLVHPLVEPLVASAEQRQLLLAGQLRGEPIVELAAPGRQRDHP